MSRLAAGITIAAVLWVLLIVAAPVGLVQGRARLPVLAAYQIGSLICHQRPERSFHLAGMQMPVCARCFGLYLSGAIGLLIAWIGRVRLPSHAVKIIVGIAAMPIAITVALEIIGAITTSNIARMSTGLPLGFAAGLLIVGSLTSESNSAMIGS
jgi:uncharacterized membrane protein